MDINIYDFYNKMEQDSIMLSFKGNVTSELLTSILQIMESKMEKLNEPNRIKKKVYNILVEELQNLYHIANVNAVKLRSRLEKINSLEPEELKAYYKEVLNNGMMSDKGGGGLGMIDIARKSGKRLDFDFQKVDEEFSFYSLNINIPQ
jgi:hypothetical protein